MVLEVTNLVKNYPSFSLKPVNFSIGEGKIVGFIGRNGAGKTTTLKCIYNLVHRDGGSVKVFGKEFDQNEIELKQEIGFMLGEVDYYSKTKLKKLTKYTKMFYSNWDEKTYEKYLKEFQLDENKKVNELSAGMKVKYSLAIALSHNAKLLILDEPTSGLDPVSRDEIIEIFNKLVNENNNSILFSTHITEDLEKCADDIIYIKKGDVIANKSLKEFHNDYIYISGQNEEITDSVKKYAIAWRFDKRGFEALAFSKDKERFEKTLHISKPDLDTIMIFTEREEK